MEKKEEQVVPDHCEIDSKGSDGLYKVQKSFFLKLREGPGVSIPVGKIVRLSRETAWQTFNTGQVIPLGIDGERKYEAIQRFIYTDPEGLYQEIRPGMKLELCEAEAMHHLMRGHVKPLFFLPLFEKKGGTK